MKYSTSLMAAALLLQASQQTCAFSPAASIIIPQKTSPSLARDSTIEAIKSSLQATTSHNSNSDNTKEASNDNNADGRNYISALPDRRNIIQKTVASILLANVLSMTSIPSTADAVDLTLLDTQAKKFKKVPAFAIVDGKTGIPFMILRNTGSATAFFFTSLDGANAVLADAKRDAAERDEDTQAVWANARISAITMEFALKLAKGRPKAMAQNGTKFDTVYDLVPSLQALSDGQRMDKTGLYNEQGRVPLFYMDEFETGPDPEVVAASGGMDKTNRIPVFFEKKDLLEQWTKKYDPDRSGKVPEPQVKVMDLVDTFSTMVGGMSMSSIDARVAKNLYPIASLESRKQAVECEKARADGVPAYKLGQMNAVGGK
uniref:Uncharacterized protein n=1 Tax=Chaetoceros debilis TaxID=122233 RepID=A0A7S3VGE7_9STRA|mmetsp:Transcript_25864/g.38251  ORF Transcript_25864/g.38251 Transcript_25864/m.38251 type:complete len:374 (-) Transcript_25864:254-1375(-)|eukprot:CAMPEP_0194089834 /NCGR_PEP_ID=MMETSP0149-20130528/36401_1 /TAXON_ID=122233 /ORGANISM="Chaetoceros debilis, Strain MM31A-1" /LENGTH=373 /DNA_ID=CAMNT_0038773907 /DNA_START=39 /DNA_END=1160 /DNA_ORIENTATION=-